MRDMDEMKLARIVDAADGIDGRVKMQKIVYFLKVMGYGVPFDDFAIRQQGPFSRAVACSADVLSGSVLDEDKKELGRSGSDDVMFQYSYRVRPEIATLIRERFDIQVPPGKPPLESISRELKQTERKVLEVAATRLFLEREENLRGDALERELRRLKGHLVDSFKEADSLIENFRERKIL